MNRLLLALLLPLAVSALFLNARWLLSDAYATIAREGMKSDRLNGTTLDSAGLAARLSPFSASGLSLHARLLALKQPQQALDEFRRALRNAPANPGLWQGFVRLKLSLGQADRETEHGMQRVAQLAPGSYAFHHDNARLALRYWYWGTPEMKRRWAESVLFTLRVNAKPFLHTVLLTRQEELFCRDLAPQQADYRYWCQIALKARGVCFSPGMTPNQAGWCRRAGMISDQFK